MSKSEPQLIDDQTITNVKNKVQNKLNLVTDTGTNMMVDLFANSDKLIETDKRVYHNADDNINRQTHAHTDNNDDNDNNNDLDDTHAKYKSQKTDNVFQQNNSDQKKEFRKEPQSESVIQSKEYNADDETTWGTEETALKKLDMLRKLGELSQNSGVKLSQNYSINSDYKTMKFEYDLHSGIRSKQNAIKWMAGMMIGIVGGIELLNDKLNPFDIKFDNTWSSKVATDITDYHDVLGKIYEKYTSPGKEMAPELKLFLMLTGSAVSIHFFKGIANLVPKAANKLDNDPNLIKTLRQKVEHEEK
jgi:hypothetical protein